MRFNHAYRKFSALLESFYMPTNLMRTILGIVERRQRIADYGTSSRTHDWRFDMANHKDGRRRDCLRSRF